MGLPNFKMFSLGTVIKYVMPSALGVPITIINNVSKKNYLTSNLAVYGESGSILVKRALAITNEAFLLYYECKPTVKSPTDNKISS